MGCEILCLIVKWICLLSVLLYAVCMFGVMKGWFG